MNLSELTNKLYAEGVERHPPQEAHASAGLFASYCPKSVPQPLALQPQRVSRQQFDGGPRRVGGLYPCP